MDRRLPPRGRGSHRTPRLPHALAVPGWCKFCGEPVASGKRNAPRSWHDGRGDEPDCVTEWKVQVDYRTAARFIAERDGSGCRGCGHDPEHVVDGLYAGGRLEVDHVEPLIDGGAFTLDNLQLLCEPCHKAKTSHENSSRARVRRPSLLTP